MAKPGIWKDLPGEFWMSADFDEPLEDFKEYIEMNENLYDPDKRIK